MWYGWGQYISLNAAGVKVITRNAISLNILFYLFLERGRERERERNITV